jgi:hypothetical protein
MSKLHQFSDTICVNVDIQELPTAFKELSEDIGKLIIIPKEDEFTEKDHANRRVRNHLAQSIDKPGIGLIDALNLIPYDKLNEFITKLDKCLQDKTPAPLVKIYFSYGKGGENKDGYNYGLNAFLFPPTCNSHIHDHQGKEIGDACISSARTHVDIIEKRYINHENGKNAYLTEALTRNKDTEVTTIIAGMPLGIGDTHNLANPKDFDALESTIAALKDYKNSRAHSSVSSKAFPDLNDNIAYSIHSYMGVDGKKVKSSVKRCDLQEAEYPPALKDAAANTDSIAGRVKFRRMLERKFNGITV